MSDSSPRSAMSVRSTSSMSNPLSRTESVRHKHNDYSCYIYVINKTDVNLQLVDAKAISGRWASGSPPSIIQPDQSTLIELNDPRGPHGSEGSCSYRLHHPRKSNAINFRLTFSDPYWAKDDNFLRATTQDPTWIALNVLKYPTNGHPFIAYVEVHFLRSRQIGTTKRGRLSRGSSVRDVDAYSDEDESLTRAGSSSDVVPRFSFTREMDNELKRPPVETVEPVDADDDSGYVADLRNDSAVVLVDENVDYHDDEGYDGTRDVIVEDGQVYATKSTTKVEMFEEVDKDVDEDDSTAHSAKTSSPVPGRRLSITEKAIQESNEDNAIDDEQETSRLPEVDEDEALTSNEERPEISSMIDFPELIDTLRPANEPETTDFLQQSDETNTTSDLTSKEIADTAEPVQQLIDTPLSLTEPVEASPHATTQAQELADVTSPEEEFQPSKLESEKSVQSEEQHSPSETDLLSHVAKETADESVVDTATEPITSSLSDNKLSPTEESVTAQTRAGVQDSNESSIEHRVQGSENSLENKAIELPNSNLTDMNELPTDEQSVGSETEDPSSTEEQHQAKTLTHDLTEVGYQSTERTKESTEIEEQLGTSTKSSEAEAMKESVSVEAPEPANSPQVLENSEDTHTPELDQDVVQQPASPTTSITVSATASEEPESVSSNDETDSMLTQESFTTPLTEVSTADKDIETTAELEVESSVNDIDEAGQVFSEAIVTDKDTILEAPLSNKPVVEEPVVEEPVVEEPVVEEPVVEEPAVEDAVLLESKSAASKTPEVQDKLQQTRKEADTQEPKMDTIVATTTEAEPLNDEVNSRSLEDVPEAEGDKSTLPRKLKSEQVDEAEPIPEETDSETANKQGEQASQQYAEEPMKEYFPTLAEQDLAEAVVPMEPNAKQVRFPVDATTSVENSTLPKTASEDQNKSMAVDRDVATTSQPGAITNLAQESSKAEPKSTSGVIAEQMPKSAPRPILKPTPTTNYAREPRRKLHKRLMSEPVSFDEWQRAIATSGELVREPMVTSKAPETAEASVKAPAEVHEETKTREIVTPVTEDVSTQHEPLPNSLEESTTEPVDTNYASEPSHQTTANRSIAARSSPHWKIVKSPHFKMGIVAFVFLTSWGFTLTRISGGLFFGKRRR